MYFNVICEYKILAKTSASTVLLYLSLVKQLYTIECVSLVSRLNGNVPSITVKFEGFAASVLVELFGRKVIVLHRMCKLGDESDAAGVSVIVL